MSAKTAKPADQTVRRVLQRVVLPADRDMDVLPLKQEFLAVMLGVSRTTVTRIAMEAQAQGLIRYARGSVEIIDRKGLEQGACECRASVQHLRRELEPDSVLGRA